MKGSQHMKIVVSQFISLDGVIEAPENWHFPYISDDMGEYLSKSINEQEAILFGRVTYEIMASAWPNMQNNEHGIADKMNSAPKYVVSSTLKELTWNNSHLISGDVIAEIRKLKAEGEGIIGMTGSVQLVQTLLQANLVDELNLFVHPIIVGTGQRLYAEGVQHKLKLVNTHQFQSGVIILSYQQAD